jgi:hypothetical protein
MHRIEGSISDLVKTLALPCKKMKRTQTLFEGEGLCISFAARDS